MTFSIEKPKRKINSYQPSSDSILTFLGVRTTPFEFVVDSSLDESKERLESQRKERGFWGWFFGISQITVEVEPIIGGTSEFKLVKKQPKHLDVVIHGSLTQISSHTSVVSGQISSSHTYLYVFYFVAMVIWIGFFWASMWAPTPDPFALFVLIWFAFICLLDFWFYKRDRDHVLERFEEAMTAGNFAKPKRKRVL